MNWYEIKITTTSEASEAVPEMLMTLGAGGVAIEDPNDLREAIARQGSLDYAGDELLNSLGEDVIVKAYFNEQANLTELKEEIGEKMKYISRFLNIGSGTIDVSQIKEEDWANNWKKYYTSIQISERLMIKPSWEDTAQTAGKIVIELDPGMAFGTGTHETTRLCLQLIEKYLHQGDKVLDVGCGSGILSIAAAKLGAVEVRAVDVDAVAVRVSMENIELNRCSPSIHVSTGELKDLPEGKADLIVANIIADIIIRLSDEVQKRSKPGGFFIASGIIKDRRKEIEETYISRGYRVLEVLEMGEWVAVVFTCPDSL